MIKLVLSDMDNTLVPFGNRRVSDFTRKAIHKLLEETDIAFGPCTGRDYVELMRLFSLDANGRHVHGQARAVQRQDYLALHL